MRRFVPLAATAVFLFGSLAPGPATGLGGQSQALPALNAEGLIGPLTVDQLDPGERVRFAELTPGSAEARRFLYTRGYLRYARLVVSGQLAPINLPELPARVNWDRRFFSPSEAEDVIDVALAMQMSAMLVGTEAERPRAVAVIADPTDRLPDIRPDNMIEPLRVDQLDADERATFATLASGSADARKFLYSRGFLRFCRLVIDGELSPLDLPHLPERENWDRLFLSEHERGNVLDVALGRQLAALLQPARP